MFLEDEGLGNRATDFGELLRTRLTKALEPYEMFKSAPGLGLLSGVEFRAPSKLMLKLSFETFRAAPPRNVRADAGHEIVSAA